LNKEQFDSIEKDAVRFGIIPDQDLEATQKIPSLKEQLNVTLKIKAIK